MLIQAPCKDCKDRTARCHCTCKEYAKYQAKKDEEYKMRAKERATNYYFIEKRVGMQQRQQKRNKVGVRLTKQ